MGNDNNLAHGPILIRSRCHEAFPLNPLSCWSTAINRKVCEAFQEAEHELLPFVYLACGGAGQVKSSCVTIEDGMEVIELKRTRLLFQAPGRAICNS
jgi:hypothetical protein